MNFGGCKPKIHECLSCLQTPNPGELNLRASRRLNAQSCLCLPPSLYSYHKYMLYLSFLHTLSLSYTHAHTHAHTHTHCNGMCVEIGREPYLSQNKANDDMRKMSIFEDCTPVHVTRERSVCLPLLLFLPTSHCAFLGPF